MWERLPRPAALVLRVEDDRGAPPDVRRPIGHWIGLVSGSNAVGWFWLVRWSRVPTSVWATGWEPRSSRVACAKAERAIRDAIATPPKKGIAWLRLEARAPVHDGPID